jgi:alkylation response protein AidB-like acyl-CoA dehydrogenase
MESRTTADGSWQLRPQYAAAASPVFRAVWDVSAGEELFRTEPGVIRPQVAHVMNACEQIVNRAFLDSTLYDHQGKLSSALIAQLAQAGYWGLLIDESYGGTAAHYREFMPLLTRLARWTGTVAGLAAVHGCIGAAGQLQRFGNDWQQRQWLPSLARGERLAAFALTEPGAGSDLTRLQTRAVRVGEELSITGDKLFITNADYGRTIGLVCLLDEQPAVVICDLPWQETESFQLVHYELHALQHNLNRGLRLRNFRVPVKNLLEPPRGDGLTIAYHGLNRGRVALCAQAAGTMRRLLASMVAWSQERITYGQPLVTRELVLRRIGRLAALIVGCDALTCWSATLLDHGYRGELEGIVTKVFASDALREAAVELALKTHGGRSFLKGHPVGDYLHDYLATSIYEGESELLSLALIRTLMKPTSKPGVDSAAVGSSRGAHSRGAHSRGAHSSGAHSSGAHSSSIRSASPQLAELRLLGEELRAAQHQQGVQLAARQCWLAELSGRIQRLIVQLVVQQYRAEQSDDRVRQAAIVLMDDLQRQLRGHRPSEDEYQRVVELGRQVSERGFVASA